MRRIKFALKAAFQSWASLRGFAKVSICFLVLIAGAAINSDVVSKSLNLDIFRLEKDRKAPVDYGYGPGAGIGRARPNLVLGQSPAIPRSMRPAANTVSGAVPVGGAAGGFFGPAFSWPIIPIYMGLLPDGRVLSYGTNEDGTQGAQFIYDIWNPSLGNGSNAHTTLPNTTSTDIFCGAASLIGEGPAVPPSLTGNMLITGGDLTVGGVRNFSNDKVNIFSPGNNTLAPSGTMTFARWYHSIITLRNGDKLHLGGTLSPGVAAMTPEVFHPASGFTTLPGISISVLPEWYYPQAFVGPDGAVSLLEHSGKIDRLTTGGAGTMQDTGSRMAPAAVSYPSVMLAPFKVLTVRANRRAQIIDISSSPPTVTDVPNLNYDRNWGNTTLLPNGQILVTGGSAVDNQLTNVAYQAEIFDPASQTWTLGASAAVPRLYHSASLLLPDGSVLTGGGGAPGPINELNAEIYYPAYLYNGSGNPAPRPTILAAPSRLFLGQNFWITVGSNDQIAFVNLIPLGFNTHSFNPAQRLISVPFTQSGTTVMGSLVSTPEKIPPGYYMLFIFNTNGVPAVAKIISVPQAVP